MNSFIVTNGLPEMIGRTIKEIQIYDLNVGMTIFYEDGGHTEICCGIHEEGDKRLGCLTAATDEEITTKCEKIDIFGSNVERTHGARKEGL